MRGSRAFTIWLWMGLALFITSCSRSPSVSFLGAFFPDWLFCLAGGLAATLVTRLILLKKGLAGRIGPLVVIYPALAIFFALAGWLLFFS